MPLSLSIATEAEADPVAVRIGDIHMAAFHSNGMLLAQFPTPAVREGLRKSIVRKTIDDIKDVKTTVVLVRDGDEIISFAKWVDPVKEGEDYEEPPWHWPEGTRHDILDEWTEKVESASERVLRNTAHYRKLRHLSCVLSLVFYVKGDLGQILRTLSVQTPLFKPSAHFA